LIFSRKSPLLLQSPSPRVLPDPNGVDKETLEQTKTRFFDFSRERVFPSGKDVLCQRLPCAQAIADITTQNGEQYCANTDQEQLAEGLLTFNRAARYNRPNFEKDHQHCAPTAKRCDLPKLRDERTHPRRPSQKYQKDHEIAPPICK
jgi:hypothetical protein